MAISFKSVGKTVDTVAKETLATTQMPIGIKTPLRMGENGEGIFAMHFDLGDQVHDNLRNLILTNWGERLGKYKFGANLKELTTEFTSRDDFDNEAVVRIKDAVNAWMPYISLNNFEPVVDHENNTKTGVVSFKVTYDVPILNITNRALEITLYVVG